VGSFARPARPRVLLIVLFGALCLVGAYLLAFAGGGTGTASAKRCAPGYIKAEPELAARKFGERNAHRACMNINHPEMPEDLAKFGDVLARRAGGERPGQIRAALRQKARIADDPSVDGASGTWQPLGKGPLVANDQKYPYTYGDAFGVLAGRISDYAYDAGTNRLWATVAQGGVWQSNDRGQKWFAISDGPKGLPMQSSGGIAWTPAGGDGGTLIVGTGDHAFSNDYSGVGVYYTTDAGLHWTHAKGVPDGGLSFQVTVDPTNPKRVYAATGLGLYRSDDAGRDWENVKLPTGDCAGDSFKANCFFANIVTSVQVQPADGFKHKGGKVAAAVGWRAGTTPNFAGKPQAPADGIYLSGTGDTGSFTKVADANAPTPTDDFGRAELATVTTPKQDSEYLYAIVQSTKAFVNGKDPELDQVPGVPACDPLVELVCATSGSSLAGIYVSHDFGKTWTVMEDRKEITTDPANGSSLNQLRPLGISAGYQTTYNQWIKVDPTQQDGSGTPTHLLFGMEEIWQNSVPGQPMNGQTRFETFAPYNQAGACLLVLLADTCGTTQAAQGTYTTHPDQHGGILLPGLKGGVDLIAGNDGGNYIQHSDSGRFDKASWGEGNQTGFHTLLPYGVAMAKDRTVWAGLQDNGQMRIDPKTGVQNEVYGGDGVYTIVNPDKSDEVIEMYPGASLSGSKDGGVSWFDVSPNVQSADFVSPLIQDPTDYKHITASGRQIAESTHWLDSTTNSCKREPGQDTHPSDPINGCAPGSKDWEPVFDLGTQKHPGDPKAGRSTAGDETSSSVSTPADPVNVAVAQAMYGAAHYVGFCGSCDPVKLHESFKNGIATNVGGSKPAKVASPDGWHIAKAQGLPNRFPTGLTIDPKDPNTVYVTLGASGARPFAPLGSLGEDASSAQGGYVYVSHDHGETFTDVTGDLPKVQASWIRLRGGQMVVANAIGMFISKDLTGKHWAELGSGFPTSPVYSFEFEPGDPNKIVVASYGRGVWEYDFTKRTGPAVLGREIAGGTRPACGDTTGPTSRFLSRLSNAARRSGASLVLRGTSQYRKCTGGAQGKVKRVVAGLALQNGKRCRYLTKAGRLGRPKSCKATFPLYTAKGTSKWSFKVNGPLPPGNYIALVAAKDDLGNSERRSRHRNFRHFRLRGRAVVAGWHGHQSGKVP
jgi:hypothetical protein